MEENKLIPAKLYIDGKEIEGDFSVDVNHPDQWVSKSFAEELKLSPHWNDKELWKSAAEKADNHFHWAKRKGTVDTIDIDHEVIEPKQLKGHEKQD